MARTRSGSKTTWKQSSRKEWLEAKRKNWHQKPGKSWSSRCNYWEMAMKMSIVRTSPKYILPNVRNSLKSINPIKTSHWKCSKIWQVPMSGEMSRNHRKMDNRIWRIEWAVIKVKAKNWPKYTASRINLKSAESMTVLKAKCNVITCTIKRNRRTKKTKMSRIKM